MKKTTPESYEVASYSEDSNKEYDKIAVINQIMKDKAKESPEFAIFCKFTGNFLQIYYNYYGMCVPVRMKEIERQAKEILDESIKFLKKEFKLKTKDNLNLKEDKSKANYTLQKVSLNERYYYVSWRFYELQ